MKSFYYGLLLSSMTACSWNPSPVAVRPSANSLNSPTPSVRPTSASPTPVSSIAKVEVSPLPSPKVSPSNTLVLPIPSVIASSPPTPSPSPLMTSQNASSGGGGGSSVISVQNPTVISPTPAPTVPPLGIPFLDDVQLTNGASIKTGLGNSGIQANYEGKQVELIFKGYFFNPDPATIFATLDNGIQLSVNQVSNTRISASFNTKLIPDLYLVGNTHLVALQVGSHTLKTNVRVASPDVNANLLPQIEQVEVIKDSQQQPVQIKLIGHNFMQNPNFSQSKINNDIAPILDSRLNGDKSEITILILDSEAFAAQAAHQVSYQTPFGLAIKQFN